FARKGFRVVAVFDDDKAKIGKRVPSLEGVTIQPVEEIARAVREKDIRLAIIAVPGEAAQGVTDRLLAAGERGLLNYAPVSLDVDTAVAVSSVDLAVQLEQLSFQVGAAASLEDVKK
ncbi:MAG: redox-sensing transcriptional repressor Rex, partial [Planctomycetota bacterium]|nr:redox-sensing transcriptional repressor Rex [Planctomycetota bacterium]